jgi:hypothetical protein
VLKKITEREIRERITERASRRCKCALVKWERLGFVLGGSGGAGRCRENLSVCGELRSKKANACEPQQCAKWSQPDTLAKFSSISDMW